MSEIMLNVKNDVLGSMSNRQMAFFLLFLNVATSAAVSIYISCIKYMAVDLHTTNALMQMTIVAHLIGEFIGRIICGPLIGANGNRRVVLPGLGLSIFGYLGCVLSPNFSLFCVMRFAQALGASVIYIVSLNIINSRFEKEEKASIVGVLELYQPIAWIVSPFIGAILTELGNWRLSFLLLMGAHIIGLLFFWFYQEKKLPRVKISLKKLYNDYRRLLKKSSFTLYALIPGLFAGGYMIFATSCSTTCTKFFGNNSADIAIFSALPLLAYVGATFVYRFIVERLGTQIAKRIGIAIYILFGLYMIIFIAQGAKWGPVVLLILMCLQCAGSAFLVPVSVFKALQSSEHSGGVGAATVVVFRNIIMSFCISMSAKFNDSITIIMASVFITVATVLVLIMMRRILRLRSLRKLSNVEEKSS